MTSARIDLAHEAPFALATLWVRPPTREVETRDGHCEVVEPRVMQVLVALARAEGGVVSRDDLTLSCWEGRVVGDDAINRVISRLRRLADGPGGGHFRVETVTRVGYRLMQDRAAQDALAMPVVTAVTRRGTAGPVAVARPGRRIVIGGSAAAGVALLAGGLGWWRSSTGRAAPAIALVPPQVEGLMEQARHAARQANPEGLNQALGLYRRVVEIAPDYADGWGALASAYAAASHVRPAEAVPEMQVRARAAAERAFALDRDNPLARLALLSLLPKIGNWLRTEQVALRAQRENPDNTDFIVVRRAVCDSTGRMREAADLIEQEARLSEPSPALNYMRVFELWSANRLEEADRAMDEAMALYPTHFAVWFTRFYLLLYTGRAPLALAFLQDIDARPPGIPQKSFDDILPVAQAMISRSADDIDRAMAISIADAQLGAGYAENAMQFSSAFGRIDDAFRIADAYFFGRGFAVADQRFSRDAGAFTRLQDRRTRYLFVPSTRAMRADPRFESLVRDLGLVRYWAESGTVPDYRRG